jgi:hypothetical protein
MPGPKCPHTVRSTEQSGTGWHGTLLQATVAGRSAGRQGARACLTRGRTEAGEANSN